MREGVQLHGGVAQDGDQAGTGACGAGQGEGDSTGAHALGGENYGESTVVCAARV